MLQTNIENEEQEQYGNEYNIDYEPDAENEYEYENDNEIEQNENEIEMKAQSFNNRNKGANQVNYLDEVHNNLIKKFKNLDKVHETQAKYKSSPQIVQNLIEDFISLANKKIHFLKALSEKM